MKLFISFLIALAIFILGILIASFFNKLIKKYGYDAVASGIISCGTIIVLTFLVYAFLK